MRKKIQSYRGKLAKQLQELKIRLEALEAFERALYWNSLSDEQAQQCNICTLNDIVQSLNGLDDDVCCMKASLVQTLAELAENPAKGELRLKITLSAHSREEAERKIRWTSTPICIASNLPPRPLFNAQGGENG